MLYFMKLGMKNVFRQRMRATLALAAIAISVTIVIIGITMTRGVEKQVFGELVGEAGELVVARKDYFEKSRFNPLKYYIKDSAELQAKLLKIEGVRVVTMRTDFGVMIEANEKNQGIRTTAVDVDQFAKLSQVPENIIAGEYLKAEGKGILIGKWVADELGLKPGDKATLLGKTVYDSFTADDFVVSGVFDMGSTVANRAAYMSVSSAQEYLEMENAVSRILVFGTSYLTSEALADRVTSAGILPEGVAIRTWRENSFLTSIYSIVSGVRVALSVIICFVAGLGILNMMTVSVMERRREIGVLMALGMSHGGIVSTFFYEALLYGVLGSVAGFLIGTPLGLYLDRVGIFIPMEGVQGMPIAFQDSTLHGDFRGSTLLIGMAIGILLSLLGMVLPVLRTFSMGPQDAMKRG